MMAYQIPVWIDCDPGHDDAIAILIASNLPSWFNLVGISTVHGNAPLNHTTQNALSLIEAFRVDENPFGPFFLDKQNNKNNTTAGNRRNDGSSSISASTFTEQNNAVSPIPSVSLQKSQLNSSMTSTSQPNPTTTRPKHTTTSFKPNTPSTSDLSPSPLSTFAKNTAVTASAAAAISAEEALFRKRNLPVNVYAGAVSPISRAETGNAPEIHGESGLDGTHLLPTPRKKAIWSKSGLATDPPPGYSGGRNENEESAAVAGIADAVRRYPCEIAIVATGALTNIAEFATRYPHLIPQVRVLSVMGGGIDLGNTTPFAEFNIWCDPEAAKIVLGSKTKVKKEQLDPLTGKTIIVEEEVRNELARKTVLLTLNMTHKALATRELREMVLNQGLGALSLSQAKQAKHETLGAESSVLVENNTNVSKVPNDLNLKDTQVPAPTEQADLPAGTKPANNAHNDTNCIQTPTDNDTTTSNGPFPTTNFVRRMLYELLEFFGATYLREFGDEFKAGPPVHDPLAVVALLPLYFPGGGPPDLKMKYTEYAMDVVTDGSPNPKDQQNHVGQTVIVGEDREYGVRVVESMDLDVFWNLLLESLYVLDRKILKAQEREREREEEDEKTRKTGSS